MSALYASVNAVLANNAPTSVATILYFMMLDSLHVFGRDCPEYGSIAYHTQCTHSTFSQNIWPSACCQQYGGFCSSHASARAMIAKPAIASTRKTQNFPGIAMNAPKATKHNHIPNAANTISMLVFLFFS